MDFSNIKPHCLPVLEQACERYAIMAFETMNDCLAIGLKSIRYSYRNDDRVKGQGEFTAKYIPWKQIGKLPRQEHTVTIIWGIEAVPDGNWRLNFGIAVIQDWNTRKCYTIEWSEDGMCMRFTHTASCIGSIGHEHKELWRSDVKI